MFLLIQDDSVLQKNLASKGGSEHCWELAVFRTHRLQPRTAHEKLVSNTCCMLTDIWVAANIFISVITLWVIAVLYKKHILGTERDAVFLFFW